MLFSVQSERSNGLRMRCNAPRASRFVDANCARRAGLFGDRSAHTIAPPMQCLHRSLICSLLAMTFAGCVATAPEAESHPTTAQSTYREAEEIKIALTYLASDQLEGRGLETQGISKAADYIATQFQSAGLKPLPGMKGYFQDFPITITTTVGKNTALSIN